MELQIKGINNVIEWFGKWPSFHDAEIIELHLNRENTSWLKILTWNITKEINEKGKLNTEKHAIVTFLLEKIVDLELADFSGQNVIFGLEIEKIKEGYRIILKPCYGLAGFLVVKDISIEIEPYNLI